MQNLKNDLSQILGVDPNEIHIIENPGETPSYAISYAGILAMISQALKEIERPLCTCNT